MSIESPKVLELKSSSFSVPLLVLLTPELNLIEQQLLEKIRVAPEFFKDFPVVFDIQKINEHNEHINIEELISLLRKYGLMPVGIRSGNSAQNKQAAEHFVPVYSMSNTIAMNDIQKQTSLAVSKHDSPHLASTLITQPIRSGQRVYAQGDLVILAQVSAGAEILAEGNIHVYGSLRGRALAGVQGNVDARIFCSDLQAELISIAGNYKLSDDMEKIALNKPVQIYLQDHALIIKDIVQ